MNLRELMFKAYPGHPDSSALPDAAVAGIEADSRLVRQGYVFVAIQGVKKDGSEFIQDALNRGAIAVVLDKKYPLQSSVPLIEVSDARAAAARLASFFYGRPADRLKVVGITGTNGKTTSSYIIEHLLLSEQKKTGVIGTINYRFPGKEVAAAETTPGPIKIQNILSQMEAAGCEYAVMEASSHALDQKRVAEIDFRAALFTNLTQDHLDYHLTMEAYFKAKAKLFTGLDSSSVAAINADNEAGARLLQAVKTRVITYGIKQQADLKAENIVFEEDATGCDLLFEGKKTRIHLPLFGLHNVYNVLGALAVMKGLGFSVERAAKNMESFPGVPGRLEAVRQGQGFKVFVDFAHTPDGLSNVLKTLQDYRRGKILTVFGCGGDRDRDKRPKMARIASEYSDFIYVTSDNPRSENPKSIADEICKGFAQSFKNYAVVLDRRKAIRQALLSARTGDIVLLAGKGHEKVQIVGAESLPFSDREEAERVLDGR